MCDTYPNNPAHGHAKTDAHPLQQWAALRLPHPCAQAADGHTDADEGSYGHAQTHSHASPYGDANASAAARAHGYTNATATKTYVYTYTHADACSTADSNPAAFGHLR